MFFKNNYTYFFLAIMQKLTYVKLTGVNHHMEHLLTVQCSECEKRFTCHELCPEMLVQVDKDTSRWREATVSFYHDGNELRVFDTNNNSEKPFFSVMEKAVLCRLGQCKTKQSISKELNISRHYLKILILRIRKKTARLFTFSEG